MITAARNAGADAVYFVTDGAVARPLESGVQVHSVFEAAPNAGITAFDVRRSLEPGAADSHAEEKYLKAQLAKFEKALAGSKEPEKKTD